MDTETEASDSVALIRHALGNAELFANWRPDMLARVVQGAKLRRYERGEQIPTGTGSARQALLVVSGFLEVSQTTSTGRRFVLGIIGPGATTGLIRLCSDMPMEYGHVVRERAVVVHFSCDNALAALNSEPSYWGAVAERLLARHAEVVDTMLEQVVLGPADQRIAATLQRLAVLFGVQGGEGVRLRLRLSQDDLADMLCVSRQTVNKELKRLEENGVIVCTYNTVTIVDPQSLANIAARRA
ncbi:MAG: Crp/Fnr family transcriptional regulator [Comamonadaceae bacterium]|nr:MAG: Crp/Fnr family transcriptional regulator [Comamonadaceae bacterium]